MLTKAQFWATFCLILVVVLFIAKYIYDENQKEELKNNAAYTNGKATGVYKRNSTVVVEYEYSINGVRYFGEGMTDSRFYGCEETDKCDGKIVRIKYSEKNPEISRMINEE